jgi:hypothetical protein
MPYNFTTLLHMELRATQLLGRGSYCWAILPAPLLHIEKTQSVQYVLLWNYDNLFVPFISTLRSLEMISQITEYSTYVFAPYFYYQAPQSPIP